MNDGWPYNVIGNLRLLHASHMQWRKKLFLTQNIELEVIFRFSCGEERMQMAELVLELGVKPAWKLSAPYISSFANHALRFPPKISLD